MAGFVVPVLLLLSPIYLAYTTRRIVEPKDELWHFGKLVCLDLDTVDFGKVKSHALSWTIKGFFLAYMVMALPTAGTAIFTYDQFDILTNPVHFLLLLIGLAMYADVCFGTVGYALTFRTLDSHIRSPHPLLLGWLAALSCYTPFVLMRSGGRSTTAKAGSCGGCGWKTNRC